ncbi:MAG TPA: prepilin-type N-terminal cleavage/methylation domain-containing protein [Gallionella sp.]|nr:prepilin-type N-terminal cleavage/methylation domain-containing protein [Gallionella sp.]
MNRKPIPVTGHSYQPGFTLVEMAIVLAIVGLLLGGLIPTLSAQMESQRINETRKQLDEIQQALMGFAIINGRLPCPALPMALFPMSLAKQMVLGKKTPPAT